MKMRFYRAQDGSQQFFISDDAIEALAETELARAGMLPQANQPIVEIEAFIERHLGAELDEGAALEPTILGLTELRVGARPRILVNRDLSDAAIEGSRDRACSAGSARHSLTRPLTSSSTGPCSS
jgi:hypothetical protein